MHASYLPFSEIPPGPVYPVGQSLGSGKQYVMMQKVASKKWATTCSGQNQPTSCLIELGALSTFGEAKWMSETTQYPTAIRCKTPGSRRVAHSLPPPDTQIPRNDSLAPRTRISQTICHFVGERLNKGLYFIKRIGMTKLYFLFYCLTLTLVEIWCQNGLKHRPWIKTTAS